MWGAGRGTVGVREGSGKECVREPLQGEQCLGRTENSANSEIFGFLSSNQLSKQKKWWRWLEGLGLEMCWEMAG